MVWNIALAVAGGLCQFVTAWLGWRITIHPIDLGDPKQRRKRILYEILFVLVGVLGVVSVGVIAYRVPRDHAHFIFSLEPTYRNINGKTSWASGTPDHRADFLQVNRPLALNVWHKNVGPGVAVNVQHHDGSFIEPDISAASENDALTQFEKVKASETPKDIGTLAKDAAQFSTASGIILSPEDYDNLVYGRRVVYTMTEISYSDDSGKHSRQFCAALEPPQQGGEMIWAVCGVFNSEY